MAKRANKSDRPLKSEHWVGVGEWERWKRDAAGLGYAEAAQAVLNAAGKATRQVYLEMMLQMDSLYPCRGWREQMDDLEAFYFKHELSIKEFSRSRQISGFSVLGVIGSEEVK